MGKKDLKTVPTFGRFLGAMYNFELAITLFDLSKEFLERYRELLVETCDAIMNEQRITDHNDLEKIPMNIPLGKESKASFAALQKHFKDHDKPELNSNVLSISRHCDGGPFS